MAHLSRILYGWGIISKRELVKIWQDVLRRHEHNLAECRAGRGQPDDSIQTIEGELAKAREALDEVNGLPNDEAKGR